MIASMRMRMKGEAYQSPASCNIQPWYFPVARQTVGVAYLAAFYIPRLFTHGSAEPSRNEDEPESGV